MVKYVFHLVLDVRSRNNNACSLWNLHSDIQSWFVRHLFCNCNATLNKFWNVIKSYEINREPSYFTGAAFGRFFGECMAFYFPEGLRGVVISPGAYSIIGAATLSGAMSHTVSPAVIAFEMTGYLGHILPCVVYHNFICF